MLDAGNADTDNFVQQSESRLTSGTTPPLCPYTTLQCLKNGSLLHQVKDVMQSTSSYDTS